MADGTLSRRDMLALQTGLKLGLEGVEGGLVDRMPMRVRNEAWQLLVRPGLLRQFEQWLGHPAWFRAGTACEGQAGPLPDMITEADDGRMLANIVQHGAAPMLLGRLAMLPQLPVSGPMQAALAVAPTLGDALAFLLVTTERANPQFRASMATGPDGETTLCFRSALPGGAGDFAVCCAGVAAVRLIEGLAFERMPEVEMKVPGGSSALPEAVRALRCRVTAGGPGVQVLLPPGLAAQTNPAASPALWQLFRDQVQAQQLRSTTSPVSALRALLARALREERVALRRAEAAARLGLAERTLSRLLAGAGTGFAEILALERRALAGELLLDPTLSLQAIADRLGFPDASTFGRTFRAWHGESPGRFRQRILPELAA